MTTNDDHMKVLSEIRDHMVRHDSDSVSEETMRKMAADIAANTVAETEKVAEEPLPHMERDEVTARAEEVKSAGVASRADFLNYKGESETIRRLQKEHDLSLIHI